MTATKTNPALNQTFSGRGSMRGYKFTIQSDVPGLQVKIEATGNGRALEVKATLPNKKPVLLGTLGVQPSRLSGLAPEVAFSPLGNGGIKVTLGEVTVGPLNPAVLSLHPIFVLKGTGDSITAIEIHNR